MGGVAVVNGSTLSTTGEMQVSCNVPYVLSVDGVEWTPTASAGGVDTYLLSTSGVVRIFINGTRYFYFVNSIVHDFSIVSSMCIQRSGSGSGPNIQTDLSTATYVQNTFRDECVATLLSVTSSDLASQDLENLGITSNQGSVGGISHLSDNTGIQFLITNVDPAQYLAVFCGNVLITFLAPAV